MTKSSTDSEVLFSDIFNKLDVDLAIIVEPHMSIFEKVKHKGGELNGKV